MAIARRSGVAAPTQTWRTGLRIERSWITVKTMIKVQ